MQLLPLILLGVLLAALMRRRDDDPVAAPKASAGAPGVVGEGARLLDSLGVAVSSRAAWKIPPSGEAYADALARAEAAHGLPHNLLARQLDIESDHFSADVISGARPSSAGAIGIGQFMPATAADLGVDPLDPHEAIDGAARYMASLYNRFGDWTSALVAYNWGQGNLQRKGLAAAPAESLAYASLILGEVNA